MKQISSPVSTLPVRQQGTTTPVRAPGLRLDARHSHSRRFVLEAQLRLKLQLQQNHQRLGRLLDVEA